MSTLDTRLPIAKLEAGHLVGGGDTSLREVITGSSGDGTKALYGDGTFKAPAGGPVQSVTVSLSSAQLLALHSSPVTIIAAPGAGQAIIVVGAVYSLTFNTTGYTVSDQTVGLYYGSASSANLADQAAGTTGATAPFQGSVSRVWMTIGSPGLLATSGPWVTTDPVAASVIANQPIVLSSQSANMTAGDGTAKLTVWYMTVAL